MIGLIACALVGGAFGASDVAVFVHGAGGGGWEYDKWKPVFEHAGWRVVAPDLVPSAGGLARTSFDDYLRQVRSWVPADRKRLVLIGASMGGILALKASETLHPDAIVLVNSVPPAGVGPSRTAKPYPEIIRWANGPMKDTRDAMPDSDEATIQWAFPRWRNESGRVLNAVAKGIKVQKPTCRVLVVLGSADTDVPTETGLALARWANADVQLYAGTSHVGPLMGRRATDIATSILHWLGNGSAFKII